MPTPSPWTDPGLALAGRHVRLIPLQASHAPGLYDAGKDPELWRFVPARMQSPSDMDAYVRAALEGRERGECLPFAIESRTDGSLSQRAIERLGAAREGVFRKHMILPDGHVRDTVYYAFTDDDWPKARDFLVAALESGRAP